MLKEQEEEEKRKKQEELKLKKEREAHAKRVAEENKRSKRFAQGGLGGGLRKPSRLRMGNSRGKVVKAFATESDNEDEDEDEDDVAADGSTAAGGEVKGSINTAAAATGVGVEVGGELGGLGLGQVSGAMSRSSGTGEVPDDVKEVIRRTAGWIHSFPDKSQVVIDKSRGVAKFDFLFNKTSPEGRFYRQVLEELKTEEEVKRVCSGFGEEATPYGPGPQSGVGSEAGAGADTGSGVGNEGGLAAMAAAAAAAMGGQALTVSSSSGVTSGEGEQDRTSQIAAQISAQVHHTSFVSIFLKRLNM
ncbi:unnamed protein product [Choristocarpus tenellus]